MGAQEEAVDEMLRAAAAEVSTSSVKRRLRIFHHTLPPLIAKAIGTHTHPTIVSAVLCRYRAHHHLRVSVFLLCLA
jgi:hypothetical protein